MCWEMDYKFFAEQKKAQETRIREEQRAGVIHKLLNEANKQGESTNAKEPRSKRLRLRSKLPAANLKRSISLSVNYRFAIA